MTEQEKLDLMAMKEKILKKKENTYDYMKSFLRMRVDELSHTGYPTIGSALEMILTRSEKEIEKIHHEFLKKYPD